MTEVYTSNHENTSSSILTHAIYYAETLGWAVFPAPAGEKKSHKSAAHSGGRKWGATKSADEIRRDFEQWPDANIGIVCGAESGIFVIDVDTPAGHDRDGFASLAALEAEYGQLPATTQAESPSGSRHFYFKHPGGFHVGNSTSEIGDGIDVRGDGGMVLAPPSLKGVDRYKWRNALPTADAPAWLLSLVVSTKETKIKNGIAREAPADIRPPSGSQAAKILEAACENVVAAECGTRNDNLNKQAFTVGRYVGSGEIGRAVAIHDLLMACDENGLIQEDGEPQCLTTIQSGIAAGAREPAVTSAEMFGSVVATIADAPPLATELPQDSSGSLMARGGSLMGPRGEILPIDADESLALDFASEHADDLRYVEEMGRWLVWDGMRWRPDKTSSAYYLVREHLRGFASRMQFQEARKVASARTVAAIERMARTDPRIATEAAMWDCDPWLLNTPGGIVDLRTCTIRDARPSDHMTKITAVAPGGDCPTFKAFLHKSLAGDVELIAFVQRMLGYALTGDTREHALFFLFGKGGNGKGVLLNTVAHIMGDYQKTAPVDTFIDSQNERHPTDLAGLRGARLVTASETEKGRRWAEAKIKMLTGGDRISARFMRQDFFEFVPQFKLVIAGNHKPSLRSVDEAMRRRMHLIPFTVNIPESERDTSLQERLKSEWGGILAWIAEGCLAWQRGGLQPPAAVRAATDEYLSGEDVLGSWLDDRCEVAADAWAPRDALFMSWSGWATNAREFVGTAKQFYEAMRHHEFEEGKSVGVRGFRGVRLKPPPLILPV